MHIEPDGEFANADVELVDVVIERQLPSPAEPITISSYAFLDIFVGWLPG